MTEKPDHFENIMKVFCHLEEKNSNSKFQRGKKLFMKVKIQL